MVLTPPASPRNTRVPGAPELLLAFSIFFGGDDGTCDEVEALIRGERDEEGDKRGL